jgi:hypothetical protein
MSQAEVKTVEVMYVGRKVRKTDPVTGHIWDGLGAVVSVTPFEWQKELRPHEDIWMDVTKLDEKARAKVVEAVREQMRAERRSMQTRVLLSDASDQDIQEEWSRRHEGPLKIVKTKAKQVPASDRRGDEGENQEDGGAVDRPQKPTEVVDAIVNAIRTLDVDNAALFDESDNPTKEAIEAVLHYPISKSELKAAIAANLQLLAS